MQEAEGANAVKAARGDVLEEAAEKLVGVETHDLDRVIGAASISEGDAVVVEREDRFVGEGGAVAIAASEVRAPAPRRARGVSRSDGNPPKQVMKRSARI
jgi:hypothetical protein